MRYSSQLRLDDRVYLLRLLASVIAVLITAYWIVPSLRIADLNEGYRAHSVTIEDRFHLVDEDALSDSLKDILWAVPRDVLIVLRDYPVSEVNEPIIKSSDYASNACSLDADCLQVGYPQYFRSDPPTGSGSLVIGLTVFTDDAFVFDNAPSGTETQRIYSHNELSKDLTASLVNQGVNQDSIVKAIQTYADRDRLAAGLKSYSPELTTLALCAFSGVLTWITIGSLARLLLRRRYIHRGVPLSRRGQEAAQRRIQEALTASLMDVDAMRLAAVVVPGSYGTVASARVERWVQMVTALTRYHNESAAIPDDERRATSFAEQLHQLVIFADDIELARKHLHWDLGAYGDIASGEVSTGKPLDLHSHPIYSELNTAITAAHDLAKVLPAHQTDIERLVKAAESELTAIPASVTDTAGLDAALENLDRAAQLLSLVADEIPMSERYCSRWLLVGGKQVLPYPRPEIAMVRRPLRLRCLGVKSDSENEDAGLAAALEPVQPALRPRKKTSPAPQRHYQSPATRLYDGSEEAKAKKFSNRLIPMSDGATLLSIVVGCGLGIGYYRWRLSSVRDTVDTLHVNQLGYATLSQALLLTSVAISVMIVLSLIVNTLWRGHQKRANAQSDRQRIINATLLTEDSLTLEIAALCEEFPAYAEPLQARFNLHREDYEELLEASSSPLEGKASGSQETAKPKVIHDFDDAVLTDKDRTTMALLVRCQALSLWRTADILRQSHRAESAWSDEVAALTTLAAQTLRQDDYIRLQQVKADLLDNSISAAQALSNLDELTETYRVARRARAVPLRSRAGKVVRLPLRDEVAIARRSLNQLDVLAGRVGDPNQRDYGLAATWSLPQRQVPPLQRVVEVLSAVVMLGVLAYPIRLTTVTYDSLEGTVDREIVDRNCPLDQVDIIDLAGRLQPGDEDAIRSFLQTQHVPTPMRVLILIRSYDDDASRAASWAQSPNDQPSASNLPFFVGHYERIVSNDVDVFPNGILNRARTNSLVIEIKGNQVRVLAGQYTVLHGGLAHVNSMPDNMSVPDILKHLFDTQPAVSDALGAIDPPKE